MVYTINTDNLALVISCLFKITTDAIAKYLAQISDASIGYSLLMNTNSSETLGQNRPRMKLKSSLVMLKRMLTIKARS
jgi:hypothetical protein